MVSMIAGLPPAQVVPLDDADFIPWLNSVYGAGRLWDFIMLQSIFVPEAGGKKFNQIIDDYLRPVRDRIAHAVLDTGELTLSADEDQSRPHSCPFRWQRPGHWDADPLFCNDTKTGATSTWRRISRAPLPRSGI
jgi:hypothetical protein